MTVRRDSKGRKLYPFPALKNQLDLAKVARKYEDIAEARDIPEETAAKARRLFKFFEGVAFGYPVAYLTGAQLELVRRGCAWADADRQAKADAAYGYGWDKDFK